MSIVSSVIARNDVQADGRRWIYEIHKDQAGVEHYRSYLAAAGFDTAAALAAYATQCWADIQASEISQNISQVTTLGSLATTTLVYTTAAANFAALRVAYQTATQDQAIMIGDFLSSLTNGQLQTAFGMTAGQVTTLRTNKLTPAATLAASIRASVGQ
jgi:hypothetical protein